MRPAAIAALVTLVVAGAGFLVSRELPAEAAPSPATTSGDAGFAAAAGEETEGVVESAAAQAGAPRASAQSYYQWVDANGSVRFARTLAEVPSAWRDRAGRITLDANDLIRPDRPSPRSAFAGNGAAAPVRTAAHDVTIYTATWCGACRSTIAFLDERGVDYVNKDIDEDPDNKAEMVAKGGPGGIPLVDIDGTLLRGFRPGEMAALLE